MIVPTVLRPEGRASRRGDRDGRRDAVDPVGVGLVELLEELAGVGREGLDVPPLPLGVERVERQRALARAADAGHDDQPVQRQVEVDPLEVVDPDLAEPDHRWSECGGSMDTELPHRSGVARCEVELTGLRDRLTPSRGAAPV